MSGETPLSEFIVWLSNDPCLVSLQPNRSPMKKNNRSNKVLGMVIIQLTATALRSAGHLENVPLDLHNENIN